MKNYKQLESELNSICLNRTDEVRALILAHLSRTHIVMLGNPGTAKSYLVRKFSEAFPTTEQSTTSIPFFEVALNNFTKPEDVFGPIDVQKWKSESELVYKTDNFLPNARIAFIDELSRGESVLNSLLTIVNERTFNVNGIAKKVPLETAVSATNFKLNAVEMEAMRDRFLQWLNPKRLTNEDDLINLWMADDKSVSVRISEDEVRKCREEVEAVKLNPNVLKSFKMVLDSLNKEMGIVLSDRRTKMMIKLIKASSWYNGHSEIQVEDLKDIWSCCWTDEADIVKIKAIINKIVDYESYVIDDCNASAMNIFEVWSTSGKGVDSSLKARNDIIDVQDRLKALKNIKQRNQYSYMQTCAIVETFRSEISKHYGIIKDTPKKLY